LVKGKRKLTLRGAVWGGLLATPVLIVAVVATIGVAVAPAGPSSPAARAASADLDAVSQAAPQTVAQTEAYWTPARIAQAAPYPMPNQPGANASTPEGTLIPMAEATGTPGTSPGALPNGTALGATAPDTSQTPQTTPYHEFIPYTRWSLVGRYTKFPNSAILKMFFSQDIDGNGTSDGNFVCSASSMGPDEAWTAGHCVSNNLGTGVNNGYSTNVMVCPSFDIIVDVTIGCWGADELWTLAAWRAGGGGNVDMGAIDTSNTGTVVPSTIGTVTGYLGFAWNQLRNQHWVAMGYPAGSPFAGGKIIMAASAYGYDDNWAPDAVQGVAMGSNLTGGSSGGPWIISYGLVGQVAGGGNNLINGHNDWKWNTEPEAMVSPYFDCRAVVVFNSVRDPDVTC